MHLLVPLLASATVLLQGGDRGLLPGLWFALTGWRLAATDLAEHRLPNILTLPGAGLALVASVSARDPPSLLALVGAAVVLGAVWMLGAVGMGDVKLGSALAATVLLLAGPAGMPMLLAATGLLAGGLVLVSAQAGGHVPLGPPLLLASWSAVILA